MKYIYLVLLSFYVTNTLNAQQKHHLEFSLGRYKTFRTYEFYDNKDKIQIAQFSYKYNITQKLGLFIAFNKAPINSNSFAAERVLADTNGIGKRQAWGKYYFYDLGVDYSIYQQKNHNISINIALSYAKGNDIYLKHLIWIPSWSGGPSFHIIEWSNEDRKASYWGTALGLKYDYYFYEDKFKLGTYFSGRYYGNDFPPQLNYGLSVGYNF